MANIQRPAVSPHIGLITLAASLAYDAAEQEATNPFTGQPVGTAGPIHFENVAADSFDVVIDDSSEILSVQIGNLHDAPLVYALDGVTTEGRKKRLTIAVKATGAASANEVQEIKLTDATGGTLALEFDGEETDPIAYDATAAAVRTALEELDAIGEGNVECEGGPLHQAPVIVTFVGALAGQNVPTLIVDDSLLTAPAPAVQITEVTKGGPGVNEVQSIKPVNAIGGTFTLTFEAKTTSAIAFDANAAAIESALEGLDSIGAGNVGVTVGDDGEFLVEFKGSLEETDVALITANAGSLTGVTPEATVTVVTPGGGPIDVTTVDNEGDFACSVTVTAKTSKARP